MLTTFLEYHPWSRVGPLRESFSAVSASGVVIAIAMAVAFLASISLSVYAATPPLFPGLRMLCSLSVLIAGVAVCLVAAYATPSYVHSSQFAKYLTTGSLVVQGSPSWLSTACAVDRVFIHHGTPGEEVQVGLSDGSAKSFALGSKADVVRLHDLFARWRTPRPDARSDAEQASDEAHIILGWLWDMQIATGGDVVSLDALTSRIVTDMRQNYATEIDNAALKAAIEECSHLRLLITSDRGLGAKRSTYATLTDAGAVHVAAWARDEGVEVYDGAGEKGKIMKVYNWGNYINDSPGAAANIGSGSANGGSHPDILPLLAQLVALRGELATSVDDLKTREELLEALDDLDHELEHPVPKEANLKKYTRAALRVAGDGVSSLLGEAAWSALESWLGG